MPERKTESQELIAIYDRDGRRIGVKTRERAHSDRDWHLLVFVWSVRIDPIQRMRFILQIRGKPDDSQVVLLTRLRAVMSSWKSRI
jgi:hypothetical protein